MVRNYGFAPLLLNIGSGKPEKIHHDDIPVFSRNFDCGSSRRLSAKAKREAGTLATEIYSRQNQDSPLTQIVGFLNRRSEQRVVIFTDAGGPYGTVRKSLRDLSLATGRPLVAFQHACTRHVTVMQHQIPVPWTKTSLRFSRAVTTDELRRSSDARQLLQQLYDGLRPVPGQVAGI
jgi:hypothetical protein